MNWWTALEVGLGVLAAKFVYDFIILAIFVEGFRKLGKKLTTKKSTATTNEQPAPSEQESNS